MVVAKLRSNSLVNLIAGFLAALLLLSLETRGLIFSKLSFVALPALLAWGSVDDIAVRLINFIILAEILLILLIWPVSLLSKAMVITVVFWYIREFPKRAFANLLVAILVLIVAVVWAPITAQF